jgi:uncharacterized protein (TIGR03067 family)
MTRYGMTLLTVGLVLVVGHARADDKADNEKLQGEWKLVSFELKGKSEEVPDAKYKFEGKNWSATSTSGGDGEGTFAIDSSKKPKSIDFTGKGRLAKGIYELDGDTLKVCMGEHAGLDRPTEFKSAEKVIVMTFKRVKM